MHLKNSVFENITGEELQSLKELVASINEAVDEYLSQLLEVFPNLRDCPDDYTRQIASIPQSHLSSFDSFLRVQSLAIKPIEKYYNDGKYRQAILIAFSVFDFVNLFPHVERSSLVEYGMKSIVSLLRKDINLRDVEMMGLIASSETPFVEMIISVALRASLFVIEDNIEIFRYFFDELEKIYLENEDNEHAFNCSVIKEIGREIGEIFEDENTRTIMSSIANCPDINDVLGRFIKSVGCHYSEIPYKGLTVLQEFDFMRPTYINHELFDDICAISSCISKKEPIPETLTDKWIEKYGESPELFNDLRYCNALLICIRYGCIHGQLNWDDMKDTASTVLKKITCELKHDDMFKSNPLQHDQHFKLILTTTKNLMLYFQDNVNRSFDIAMEGLWYFNHALLQYALFFDENFTELLKELDYNFQLIAGRMIFIFDKAKSECDMDDKVSAFFHMLYRRKNIDFYFELWRKYNVSIDKKKELLYNQPSFEKVLDAVSDDEIIIDFISIIANISKNSIVEEKSRPEDYFLVAFVLTKNSAVEMFVANYNGEDTVVEMVCDILDKFENRKRKIAVCFNSICSNISFASIKYKNGYVIDYFAVRNIVSIYELIDARNKGDYKKNLVVYPVICHGWEPLHSSKDECEYIIDQLRQKKFEVLELTQHKATKQNVENSLKNENFNIVHISTHGEIDAYKEDLYMVLAGENGNGYSKLYESELVNFASKINIIVFSLCVGGKMKDGVKDSISGFIRAMLLSGATSIIAPLDYVHEDATRELFKTFYSLYLNDENTNKHISEIWQNAITDFRQKEIKLPLDDKNRYIVDSCDCIEYWGSWVLYTTESI